MSDLDNSLDMAFSAYNAHQFDMAEDLAREVLTVSPSNGDALYLLGLIAYRAGALEPAEKLLYDAVKLYPQSENYALALASVLQKAGRGDEALSFYVKYPDNAEAVAQMGYIYLQKRQADFAQSAFEKALNLNKACLSALIGQAIVLRMNGRHSEALNLLNEAAKIGVNAELNYQLSVQNRLNGNNAEALSHIEQALIEEQTASFYNEKGLVLERLERFEEAQQAYETAIDLNPYAPDSFANLGNLFLQNKLYRQAEDRYKKALALDNAFLNAHHNLAVALCGQDRKAEGLEHYREALLISKNHIPTLYNLAMLLEEMGDYSEAAGMYFNILALKAKPEMIEFRIADTLAALAEQGKNEAKEAVSFAKGWVKHFPDSVVAAHTLNALTHQSKEAQTALSYAKELYNSFAASYDETMEKLEAKALTAVCSLLNDSARDHLGAVLDLACGTGTLALKLQKPFETLTGVDFSAAMLEKAKQKNKYTQLVEKDVVAFLKADTAVYDFILAVELTGYLPTLNELFDSVLPRLKQNGQFIFTIENATAEKMELSAQGRYLYQPKFVEKLLVQTGFEIVRQEEIDLRKEGSNGAFAKGTLFVASVKI